MTLDTLFADVATTFLEVTGDEAAVYYSDISGDLDVTVQVSTNVAVVNEMGTVETRAVAIFKHGAVVPGTGDTITSAGKTWDVRSVATELSDEFFTAVYLDGKTEPLA